MKKLLYQIKYIQEDGDNWESSFIKTTKRGND